VSHIGELRAKSASFWAEILAGPANSPARCRDRPSPAKANTGGPNCFPARKVKGLNLGNKSGLDFFFLGIFPARFGEIMWCMNWAV